MKTKMGLQGPFSFSVKKYLLLTTVILSDMAAFKIPVILVLLMITCVQGFSQKKKVERAEAAYHAGEYHIAVDLFKDAYSSVRDADKKNEMVYMVAECYRLINQPEKAELWFRRALKRDFNDPEAVLHYADVLKMNQKYEDARNEYKRYQQLVPDDPRGQEGAMSCDLAIEWLENPTAYEVEDIRIINSRASDFSPVYAREDHMVIYFSSSRDEATGNDTHGATGESFSDIFETQLDRKGKWSVPVPLEGSVNTEYDEGKPSLSYDYRTMYFTRCMVTKRKKMGCQVYVSERSGTRWGKEELIVLAPDSMVAAHPAISPDNLTLYFVSDMPGGFGGKDIWKVTRESETTGWGRPENLGPRINTLGDEVFPYVHPDGTLYFSSDRHPGMGGLDIFRATRGDDGQWIVENMRYPINSFADDFGITFHSDQEKGLFTSSRKGRGNDDIFSFVLPPLNFNLIGVVRDEKTEEVLPDATVKLVGSDGITIQTETNDQGRFRFMLNPNTDYVFLVSKEGYLNGKGRETTKGQEKSRDFRTTVYLASIEKPIEISHSNVFYDFARWDLRPEAMVSLDRLVETLNDNPNITIELMSHTDSRDTEAFNLELSQKRAQSVVDYLIEKGIDPDRLQARGYGESMPKVVTEEIHREYEFLPAGQVLDEEFINSLPTVEQQEIAHQINRRTEFRVLSTDYSED